MSGLLSLLKSRKFWLSVVAILAIVLKQYSHMTDTEITQVIAVTTALVIAIAAEDRSKGPPMAPALLAFGLSYLGGAACAGPDMAPLLEEQKVLEHDLRYCRMVGVDKALDAGEEAGYAAYDRCKQERGAVP